MRILCVPNFILKWGNYATRAAVAYVISTKQLFISNAMIKSINKCSKNNSFRFIYFSFVLINSLDDNISHSNIVIIDLFKNTIELFEPHGHYNTETSKIIDKLVFKKILKKIKLDKFKYIPPSYISPKLGIQSKADAYCGMCITVSMMYLHLRILNPDINQKKIVKHLLSYSRPKLKEVILKYARHVEETLKKNRISVIDFDKEYIQAVDKMFN